VFLLTIMVDPISNILTDIYHSSLSLSISLSYFIENVMQAKHKDELINFQQTLISKPEKARFSKELFNLRKIQDTLAKQKKYDRCLSPPISCHIYIQYIILMRVVCFLFVFLIAIPRHTR
jgi:hypothetical protein